MEKLIQNRNRARQLIDFSGIRIGNITPTDIDGCIEYRNKALVLFEMKRRGAEIPKGQELALTRIIDNHRAAGKQAVLFICEHDVDDWNEDVDAARTTVRKFYWNFEWHDGRDVLLKDKINNFIRFVDKDKF